MSNWLLPVRCALLVALLALHPRAAESQEAQTAIDPAAKVAVDTYMRTHRAERRRTTPLTELGVSIRDIRIALRDVMTSSRSGGGPESARMLDAAVQRALDLLAEAETRAESPSDAAHVQLIGGRLSELQSRATAIVEASSEPERSSSARVLLHDIEAKHGDRNRLLGGPIRMPSLETPAALHDPRTSR